jgi:acyl-CoA synthetase (AMP-forming)/AMP-acid ligase II
MNAAPAVTDHILTRIAERARRIPEQPAVRLVQDHAGTSRLLTWRDIERLAWQGQVALEARGLKPGDRLLIMLPTGEAQLAALLGAFRGGVLPSIIAPLSAARGALASGREWQSLIGALAPHAIASDDSVPHTDIPRIQSQALLAPATLPLAAPSPSDAQALAYIQFSSGSTGTPRGLALSWEAIHRNLSAIIDRTQMTPADQVVSWVPMYHDMGLFGTLLTPLYVGCGLTLLDSALFVASPMQWIRLLSAQRATFTIAPPSAVNFCLEFMRRRPPAGLDLSNLKTFLCGSEHVSPRLVSSFNEVLAPYGVRADVLKPAYGLAEATLSVTMPTVGSVPRLDAVDENELATRGRARPTRNATATIQHWVSSGPPTRGVDVRIADKDGQKLPERQVGHVLIRSPSLMSGVIEGGVFTPRDGAWLDSGDLGYMADGELYVTGRDKDIIIKNGRNYSPERLEELACLAEGAQRAAAFGVFDERKLTERIVLLIEARNADLRDAARRDRLRLEIRALLTSAGYALDEIRFLAKGGLPRTTSGKLRRRQCRDWYLAGLAVPSAASL